MPQKPNRIPPLITPQNELFWTAGSSEVALVATGGSARGGCMLLARG